MAIGNGTRRVLVISFSDLQTDPRVHRQIAFLSQRFSVTAAGHRAPAAAGVEFVPVSARHWSPVRKLAVAALLKARRFESAYWSSRSVRDALEALRARRFDLIVANDILALPLAAKLRGNARILFDAHEYSPLEFEDSWKWRYFFGRFNDYLCRTYLREADAMFTVSQGIADEYRANYGVEPELLVNAPPFQDLSPVPTGAGDIRLVHHGAAIVPRRIETMIECMAHLDERFHLDLMLVPGDARYLEDLRLLAAGRPRVRMVAPVPMTELPRHLNRYDVGLCVIPPANFNYRHALPNKFFEFIQARLAVAIGPSSEMAKLVRQYDCGAIAEDFTPRALARQLDGLDAGRVDHFKRRSHEAAKDLCFESNAGMLQAAVDRLLGSARCAA